MTDDDQQSLFGDAPGPDAPEPPCQQRLIRSAVEIEADDPDAILFQHTVFCQTGLPYRNPGEAVRIGSGRTATSLLRFEAGEAMHPANGRVVSSSACPSAPSPA